MKNKKKLQKMLGIGLLGAVMGLVGDFLLGWLVYPTIEIPYIGMIAGCADLSYARMGLSMVFGGLGIPLQYFGFRAVSDIIRAGGHEKSAKLVHLGAAATAALGGAVHILCVVAMYLVRVECDHGFEPLAGSTLLDAIPDSAMQFALWGLLPFTAVFYVLYLVGLVTMFVAFAAKYTNLPRLTCLFNPLLGMWLINTATGFLPNTELVNSLRMGNMGFGSLIAFSGVLVMLSVRKDSTSED